MSATNRTTCVYVRIPNELKAALETHAEQTGRKFSEMVTQAVARGMGWTAEYRTVKEELAIEPPPQDVPEAVRLGAEVRRLGLAR